MQPRVAFRYPNYVNFFWARCGLIAAHQMTAVALGQYVYERTHQSLHLGYLGLAIFLPRLLFMLPAGHWADRYPRRRIMLVSRTLNTLLAVVMALALCRTDIPLGVIYGLLALASICSVVDSIAAQALVPDLVATEHFPNAVTWNSVSMQLAAIGGPLLGGAGYAVIGAVGVAVVVVAVRAISTVLIVRMRVPPQAPPTASAVRWSTVFAGVRYVFATPIILGTISLDLFAVLFGGAVALLPIYANEILRLGPAGLGLLRAAPGVGAAAMALWLAYRPIDRGAGRTLLCAVAIFGAATIGFGLSRSVPLTLLCLVTLGAADMISVVVRGVIVQLCTPPVMRGRVSAVSMIFIGASNELGEFESGVTAHWFGVVPATVLGGGLTMLVVALWSRWFPQIRKYDRLGGECN